MSATFYLESLTSPRVRGRAGDVAVPCGVELRPIKELSPAQVLKARDCLELAYGDRRRMQGMPGGEKALRMMLRAIRCWLGPEEDSSLAVDWPVLCLVVPEVMVRWKSKGEEKSFTANVRSVDDWVRWAEAEINLFRCNLWRVTLGKINLRPEVRVAPCAITCLNSKGKLGKRSFQPLVNDVQENQFLCVFFFGPKNAREEPPEGYGACCLEKPLKRGTYGVWLPVSEERMGTPGAAGGLKCFRKSKRLPHEFWHVVRLVLTKDVLPWGSICIPVIDGTKPSRQRQARKDLQSVKNELAELNICLRCEARLEEYYAMWPTWRQAQEVARCYKRL